MTLFVQLCLNVPNGGVITFSALVISELGFTDQETVLVSFFLATPEMTPAHESWTDGDAERRDQLDLSSVLRLAGDQDEPALPNCADLVLVSVGRHDCALRRTQVERGGLVGRPLHRLVRGCLLACLCSLLLT